MGEFEATASHNWELYKKKENKQCEDTDFSVIISSCRQCYDIITNCLHYFHVFVLQVQLVVHSTMMNSLYCQSSYSPEIICIVMYVNAGHLCAMTYLCNLYFLVCMAVRELALEDSNVPSIRSPVMDEKRTRPGQ